jgi:phosphatidylinositol 4-kinase
MIEACKRIFEEESLGLYLRTYEILVTSATSGILEFVPNTMAIDGIKKLPNFVR